MLLESLPLTRRVAFDELERTTAGALSASDRMLGPLAQIALWGNLGAGLLLLAVGALLVPALSIPQAIAATALGACLGGALVGMAVALGGEQNRPAVVLHRSALGESGAHLYASLALARHLAWGGVQLAIAAALADALLARQGIAAGQPAWAVLFAAATLLLVLAGPGTALRRWFVPGAALTLVIALVFFYSAWSDYGIPTMLSRDSAASWPTFTGAVDLVAAAAIIWLPVATDLGRLSTTSRSGAAAFAGIATATAWFVLLGALFLPLVDGNDLAGFLLSTPLGALAIIIVIVLELDGAFVTLYGVVSTARGWMPKADAALPAAVLGAGVFAIGGALLDPFRYGDALLLLGAAFVPLLGVLLGARAALRLAGPATRPAAGGAIAWAIGFLLYNWASPLSVPAWTASMRFLFADLLLLPYPLNVPGISATVMSFCAASIIAGFAVSMRRRSVSIGALP